MEGDFRIKHWLVQPHLNAVVRSDNTCAKLEPKVMEVLVYLADHVGEVVSKEAIFQSVWSNTFVTDDALIRCIVELRKAFEDDVKEPRIIQTIAKRGYRLIGEVRKLTEARSRYEIIRKLGQGGMAEVYLAKDQELRRNVALKFLPEEKQRDEHLRKRLIREARAAASLDHPFICKIYDVGEMDGKPYIAMEYLEGQTLKERLESGKLPMKEGLKTGLEIAEALEVAHERGIVHRDLKPANVMLTSQGHAKVLDFGVAKHVVPQGGIDSEDQTISALTRREVTVGTLSYMSPEQLRGEAVDSRSDIFSFGIVVHEMLAGVHPFRKETGVGTSNAILNETPKPISRYLTSTPLLLDHAVRKMLAKDAARRYQVIQDVRTDLQEVAEERVPASETRVTAEIAERVRTRRPVPVRWLVAGILGAAVVASAVGVGFRSLFKSRTPMQVTRSVIKLEPGFWLDGIRWPVALQRPTRTAMALSSSGRFIVYSAIAENPGPKARSRLFLRRTDQIEARPISGTEGGISPFLSPDDQWMGWWAPGEDGWNGRLMKVSIDGGVPLTVCEISMPLGVSWGTDNTIVFAHVSGRGLYRVAGDGGNPESLTMPDRSRGEYSHRLPHHLPDGRHVLFTTMKGSADLHPRIAILDLATRDYRVLLEDAADARYAVTGHLIFMRRGTLMAVGFDTRGLRVTGRPAPVIDNVMQALNTGSIARDTRAGQFSVSDSGSLAYATGGVVPDPENSLVWVGHEGMDQTIVPFKAGFSGPRLSPDGGHILYSSQGRVWVYDIVRSTATPVTDEGTGDAIWTPNGQRIVFNCGESSNLCWQPVDGSAQMERLTTSDAWQWPGSWTPDGETLSFSEMDPDTADENILLLRVRDRKVTPYLHSRFVESAPEFSPDGRWLAYASGESGRSEVYVRPFPGPGGRWQVSNEGGAQPLWARDGRRLFYLTRDRVWVVDVAADKGFRSSKPRLLLDKPGYTVEFPFRSWDLSLDGKRFLLVKLGDVKPQPVIEMILVENWFEELKRLAR